MCYRLKVGMTWHSWNADHLIEHLVTTSPTALITRHLSLLTPYEHAQFYNLSYVNFPPDLDPENDFAELALAIFQTNAVSTGVNSVGIFPRMARLNHGCSSAFNVVYTWREKEGMLMVHAIRDIQKGEVRCLLIWCMYDEVAG